jgi:hypothetical protein
MCEGFTREFLTENNMTIFTHPPCFSLSSPIEDTTERPPFKCIEVIEAEPQAVLNILTEHDFQDALKNGRSAIRKHIL